ncbi:MAG TPA: L,D-transpeptidase family protein [Chitinophagaceae bacterium]|nr:L,D-transpeptidase family protein [Chitinophagaceae bacterium]
MNKKGSIIFPVLFVLAMSSGSFAQVGSEQIVQLVRNDAAFKKLSLQCPAEVKQVYEALQFQAIWLGHSSRIRELLQLFQQSANLGLNKKDYQNSAVQTIGKDPSGWSSKDSLTIELRLTDAAIHFVKDIADGNAPLQLGYNGLNYRSGCSNIPGLLAAAIQMDRLLTLPAMAEQKTEEYNSIKNRIIWLNAIMADSSFKEVIIKSTNANSNNRELFVKLYQLGLLDSATQKLQEKGLKTKIRSAQELFNLTADSVLRSNLVAALNVPLRYRLEELKLTINILRALNCIKQSSTVIIVNIPSATVLVYDHGKNILESRIIVGKRSTPTSTLCSKVTDVVLYPYWMVPYSIATKELLPAIKRNIGYLDAGNYQVINKAGKVMNPYAIDWQSLSRSYFPYIIRQSTGCDNSLGLVKLNFYNPFGAYLHDTPAKKLFAYSKRYFSHGCMRVQKAMELAHIVLKNNSIALDTLEDKGCLRNKAPVIVPADQQLPVFVIYTTAWIDANGRITFNEDVYRKLSALRRND